MAKPVVLKIDNVRIVRFNDMNLAVESYEKVFIPKKKQHEMKWVFQGYTNTILASLKYISRNELLIDETAINDLNDYVRQVEESNNTIIKLKEQCKND